MDTLTPCTKCNGRGWLVNVKGNGWSQIPCVDCNTRGVVCNQLYSEALIEFDKAKKFPDPSDFR